MAAVDDTECLCLVCEANLDAASCMNIFYTSLPRNGELLASFVLQVLRSATSELRSSYICLRCYNLFQMLEQAQLTVANIRGEILKVYHSRDTSKVFEQKINLPGGQVLHNNNIFISDNVQDRKNIGDNNQFDVIEDFRTLNDGISENIVATDSLIENRALNNDFNALNIDITNIDDLNVINTKREIETSLVDVQRNNQYNCKLDNILKMPKEMGGCIEDKENETLSGNVAISDSLINNRTITNDFNAINIEINASVNLESSLGDVGRQYSNKLDNVIKLVKQIERSNDKENETSLMSSENCSTDTQDLTTNISTELMKKSECSTIEKTQESARFSKINLYTRQCRICARRFKSAKDLECHTLKHGGSRPYRCRKCDERFQDNSLANSHAFEFHSTDKNCIEVATQPLNNEIVDFSNEDCISPVDRSGKSREPVENGVSEDTNESDDNSKVDGSSWKSGRMSKYSMKPPKYPCPKCGKKWRTLAELKTHDKSHSNLRPYMCEKCGQAYKHKHALEIHIGMHNGTSPFQCSVCKKCFTQKGALMRHLPMHTGEMPFQCELCGKRFVHRTSYNMHALSHTGKKSYQCDVCDLSLLSTSHLKRHMRVHTGEKPYSCTLCNKSFAERYNLFAHQKIHDPVEIMAKAAKKMTYKCDQCDTLFDKKHKLDDHTKKHRSNSVVVVENRKK